MWVGEPYWMQDSHWPLLKNFARFVANLMFKDAALCSGYIDLGEFASSGNGWQKQVCEWCCDHLQYHHTSQLETLADSWPVLSSNVKVSDIAGSAERITI